MDLNTISLIVTGIIALIILLSVLFGVIRGFKKSIPHGIFNLVLVIVLVIFTKMITNIFINVDISALNLNINGETVTSLNQLIINMLTEEPTIAEMMASSQEAVSLVTSLPLLIASPFVFTILFWGIKLIAFVISLIATIIKLITLPFRKKDKNKPKLNANGVLITPVKKSKKRWAGALIGLATGLIIIFATFTPVFGVASIMNNLNSIKLDENGNPITTANVTLFANEETTQTTNKTLLTELLDEDALQYLDLYNSCVGINIARFTGIEALGSVTFNNLASTKVNETQIKLVDELNSVVGVYNDYIKIDNYLQKDALTQEEMSVLIYNAEDLITNVFKVNTLNALGNYLLPKVIDGMLNDPDFPIKLPEEIDKDQATKIIVEAALNVIKDYPFDNIKNILLEVTSTLKLLNDNNILTPIYNASKAETELTNEDYLSLIKGTNDTFAEEITNKLTSINIVKDLAPSLIDSIFTSAFESLGIEYSSNNITKEKATEVFNIAISNAINLIKTLDTTKEYLLTTNSFEKVGNILNITKDNAVLSETQYNDLITKLQTELKNAQLPINISTAITNISKVENWSTEMSKFALTFSEFESLYEDIKNMESLEIDNINLPAFGKLFDKLEETTIFDGAIKDVYNDVLNSAKEQMADFSEVFEILKISANEIGWENELTALKPLLDEIIAYQNKNFNSIESAKEVLDLVAKFDEVEQNANSVIYSAKMEPLLKEVLNVVKANSNNETITGIVTDVNNRINARTDETLETCVLKGIFDYSTTLIPDASEFTDANISAMIGEIKTNISNLDNLQNVDYNQKPEDTDMNILLLRPADNIDIQVQKKSHHGQHPKP